jgi:hypothetical protein
MSTYASICKKYPPKYRRDKFIRTRWRFFAQHALGKNTILPTPKPIVATWFFDSLVDKSGSAE